MGVKDAQAGIEVVWQVYRHNWESDTKLQLLVEVEASGTPCVAVKCVDIRRNTSGEGGLLGFY